MPSAAHHAANPTSDHERGDAYDLTVDRANGPDPDALAAALLADPRVHYVIWNRQIANRQIESGAWRPYALTAIQTDPHTSHVHVSIDPAQRDDARPWSLDGSPLATVAPPDAPSVAQNPPAPSGWRAMQQARVTPAMAAWAAAILHDPSAGMFSTQTRSFDGVDVLARVEWHPADARIAHVHRGVSLFEGSAVA
jgi:hypothetical protein